MTTIRLYGVLGKNYGKVWRLNVNGVRRAVDAIDRLKPGFRRDILKVKGAFRVRKGRRILREEHFNFPTQGDTISITPLYGGAAGKGLAIGEAVLGAVLIVVGAVLLGTPAGVASPYLIMIGAGLLLGGVAALLSPVPNLSSEDPKAKKASYQFSGPVNTVAQGSPVPVCLGQMMCGSAVGSEGLNSLDIIENDTGSGGGSGGYSDQGPGTAGKPIWHAQPY